MKRFVILALASLCGCSGANRNDEPDLVFIAPLDLSMNAEDQAKSKSGSLVINEAFPAGSDPMTDPDWVELKNTSSDPIALADYMLSDSSKVYVQLPAMMVAPGAYLVVLCDDAPDGGSTSDIHVPFKLKQGGDEVHLKVSGSGDDSTAWKSLADGKSWARIPDGTGGFVAATPTKLATNTP